MILGNIWLGRNKSALWVFGGMILLSFTSQNAFAASGKAQCTASVEEYIASNNLNISEETKAQSIDKCMAGLVNAQNLLETSTREVITRCDEQLKYHVATKGLEPPNTKTWGVAMDQCTQGDMAGAQTTLDQQPPLAASQAAPQAIGAAAPAPQAAPAPLVETAPAPAPAPSANAMNAPAEQGGNITGRVMSIPSHTASPQPAQGWTTTTKPARNVSTFAPAPETGLVEKRRGPASAGRTRCLPQMDDYIYSNGLAPAGSSFQRAVELCHVGQIDEAKALLTKSDNIIKTQCNPAFKAHLEQNPALKPTRMAKRIALDLCANGKMNEALAELDREGTGRQEAKRLLSSGTPEGEQEAYYSTGETKVRGGGITQGVRETEVGGTSSRAFCVGELNGYAKENTFVPSTVAFSRAVGMCQEGRIEAGKKEIRLSNAEVVATCEPKLYQLLKKHNLSPSKQWWTGAMNLCADGKEAEAVQMITNSEKAGDRAPSAPGPKTDISPTEPLAPFRPMNEQAPQAVTPAPAPAPAPAPVSKSQPIVTAPPQPITPQPVEPQQAATPPQPMAQPEPTVEVLTPPPFGAHTSRYQASPSAPVVVEKESCAIKMDKFVVENNLTPSRDGYMEARRACEAGHEKVAQVALLNSNARTMTVCDPILKSHLKTLGSPRVDPAKWQRALALCANGKEDQAKTTLQ